MAPPDTPPPGRRLPQTENRAAPGPDLLGLLRSRQLEREAIERAERARRETLDHLVALLRQGTIESSSALDIGAESVTDADVPELLDRRAQLHMAARFVDAARAQHAGDTAPARTLRAFVARNGGLLEHEGYSHDEVLARVRSPRYVISHARGRVLDPADGRLRPSVYAADAQIELPDDMASEPLAFVPDPATGNDTFFPQQRERARRVAADIRMHPASAAVLRDVSVAPYQPHTPREQRWAVLEYRNKKLASAVTNHAIARIEAEVNPHRRQPIRYLIAAMFRVSSVVLAEGPEVVFDDPITNDISVLVHSVGSATRRCFLGWEAPVERIAAPDGSLIIATWLTAVRLLGPELPA
jgi:hypothetical protein